MIIIKRGKEEVYSYSFLKNSKEYLTEGGKLRSHGGEHSHRGVEGKAERSPHRVAVPTSTHQPERLVCTPARVGRGWELRLGLQSDHGKRTGVGGVNTAGRGLVRQG